MVCGVVIILLCQVKKRYFEKFKSNLLYGGKFVHNSLYNTNVLWTKNPPKNKQEKHVKNNIKTLRKS